MTNCEFLAWFETLAIEDNTLGQEQVSTIVNGKPADLGFFRIVPKHSIEVLPKRAIRATL